MKYLYLLSALIFVGLSSGCDRKAGSENLYLMFMEEAPETEAGPIRAIVTADYLRLDDGEGSENFILFDRKQRIIYSVARDRQQIITISEQKLDIASPLELKLSNEKQDDKTDVPSVGGKKPVHYKFKSGDEVCYETMSVKGMLPAYGKAMSEYHEVLASDSMVTLNSMPADLHNGCDLARHTYAPNRHFKQGLPVVYWQEGGASISLLDYKEDYQADKLLFELPKGYQQFSITELRGGAGRQ